MLPSPSSTKSEEGEEGQYLESDGKTRFFLVVYGTLMRGHGNHRLLNKPGVEFMGVATTKLAMYEMVCVGFPMVYNTGNSYFRGEMYSVDGRVLADCDQLEGHPNWYERTPTVFRLPHQKQDVKAQYYRMKRPCNYGFCDTILPDSQNILAWSPPHVRSRTP